MTLPEEMSLERSLDNIPFATQIWSNYVLGNTPSDNNKLFTMLENSPTTVPGNVNRYNKTQKRALFRPNRNTNRLNNSSQHTKVSYNNDDDTKKNNTMDTNTCPQRQEQTFCGSLPSGLLGDIPVNRQDWSWDANKEDDLPTQLNLRHISRFLRVSSDRLTVCYVGSGSSECDVGTVQADKPILTGRVDVFYFEVEILSCDSENISIAVGLSRKLQDFCKSIGEEPGSFAYRGRDGKVKTNGSLAMNYATPYQQGDVIGCGYIFETRQIFFTKNGVFLGMAFSQVENHLYASVSLHRPNEKVSFRFGCLDDSNSPFVFNHSWRNEWKESRRKKIQSIELTCCVELVAEYLLRCGYSQTLQAFKSNTDGILSKAYSSEEEEKYDDSVEARGKVRHYIMQGKVEQAISFVEEHKPNLLQVGSWSCFALTCQRWIEWLRDEDNADLSEMRQVSVSYLSPLITWMSAEQERFFYRMITLLAFEKPQESPLKHLFSIYQRSTVADIVNDAWLQEDNLCHSTLMESIWKQSRIIERCLFYDTFLDM